MVGAMRRKMEKRQEVIPFEMGSKKAVRLKMELNIKPMDVFFREWR